nr:hypothetical protein [Deltaproteobacteria bacterium]
MRAEDKQLEGLDLEREEELHREQSKEEELRELGGEEVRDAALDHDHDRDRRGVILGAIRAIFERDTVLVSGLGLPQREEAALGSLQSAVSGRAELGTFVYATDRRDLLEQALAVLQPNLTNAEPELLAMLGSFDDLTARLGGLRAELSGLEEAQEGIPAWEKQDWFGERRPGDEPETGATPDAALDGPEREPEPAQPSTLV